jgi:hypothetical protein
MLNIHIRMNLDDDESREALKQATREALNLVVAMDSEETFHRELEFAMQRLIERSEGDLGAIAKEHGIALYGFTLLVTAYGILLKDPIAQKMERLDLMRRIEDGIDALIERGGKA